MLVSGASQRAHAEQPSVVPSSRGAEPRRQVHGASQAYNHSGGEKKSVGTDQRQRAALCRQWSMVSCLPRYAAVARGSRRSRPRIRAAVASRSPAVTAVSPSASS